MKKFFEYLRINLSKNHFYFIFIFSFLLLFWFSPNLDFYLNSVDHGYQLGVAKQICLGKIPFIDLVYSYGPLIGYSRSIFLCINDSLITETMISIIGYSIALLIIYFLISRYTSKFIGLLGLMLAFLLLARFYKWYYWIFPLLIIYLWWHYFNDIRFNKKNTFLLVIGTSIGISGLFRLDLGIALLIASILIILMFNWDEKIKHLSCLILSSLVPILGYIAFISLNRGDPIFYFKAIFDGAISTVSTRSYHPFIQLNNFLSYESFLFLLLSFIPLYYMLTLIILYYEQHYNSRNSPLNKTLFITAIIGISIFPQALHASEIQHILQIIPPFTVILLISVYNFDSLIHKKRIYSNISKLIIIGIFLFILIGLHSQNGIPPLKIGGTDMSNFELNPLPKYEALMEGPNALSNHPITKLIKEIKNQTNYNDYVLYAVPSLDQLTYFGNRPIAGIFQSYFPGIYDDDYWREQDIKKIRMNSPKIAIVKESFMNESTVDLFRDRQPELFEYLSVNYNRILYKNDGYLILSKN